MNRRELLKMVAAATGGVVIGGEFFLAGCTNPDAEVGVSDKFSEADIAFLDEVSETIFPKTSTPGAKDAKVGQFMVTYVNDCLDAKNQKAFHEGIKKIDDACKQMHKHGFMKASAEHRKELLISLDKERAEYQKNKKQGLTRLNSCRPSTWFGWQSQENNQRMNKLYTVKHKERNLS